MINFEALLSKDTRFNLELLVAKSHLISYEHFLLLFPVTREAFSRYCSRSDFPPPQYIATTTGSVYGWYSTDIAGHLVRMRGDIAPDWSAPESVVAWRAAALRARAVERLEKQKIHIERGRMAEAKAETEKAVIAEQEAEICSKIESALRDIASCIEPAKKITGGMQ